MLPFLIPMFAGLSATGALAGGAAAGITKAVNDPKAPKQQLEENKRHNKTMESVALGNGLAMGNGNLKSHKVGLGLHLKKKVRPNIITSASTYRRRHIKICKSFKNT